MEAKRFAVITQLDTILWESDDVEECYNIFKSWGEEFCKGVYDYEQCMYLDIVDILDITGCQLHSP